MSKEFFNTFPILHSNESLTEALTAARSHQKYCIGMKEMRVRQHAEVEVKAPGSPNANLLKAQVEVSDRMLKTANQTVIGLERESATRASRARSPKPRGRVR